MINAKGTKGFIVSSVDGMTFFRVYDKGSGHTFVDYEIRTHDVAVRIIDDSLVLVPSEDGVKDSPAILDYSPRTLKQYPQSALFVYHTKEIDG